MIDPCRVILRAVCLKDRTRRISDPEGARAWLLRQTLADPDENHDWVIEARVDLDASDAAGEAVVLATGLRRL